MDNDSVHYTQIPIHTTVYIKRKLAYSTQNSNETEVL